MSGIFTKEINWGGAKLSLETGRIARQAESSVLVRYNDTVVLVTLASSRANTAAVDKKFYGGVPLLVNFVYKAYSSGKIPSGFIKREGKQSEREVLASRVIDRAIRPLFVEGFSDDVHVVCTLLSYDSSVIPEVPALIGVSAALTMSSIPFVAPVGIAHVGYSGGEYTLNTISEENMLDLIVAGTAESLLMVESEAQELSEEVMLKAVTFAHDSFIPVIDFINEFANEAGKKEKAVVDLSLKNDKLADAVKDKYYDEIAKACLIQAKNKRSDALASIKEKALNDFAEEELIGVDYYINKFEKELVRNNIFSNNIRLDGRKNDDIREIDIVPDILPNTHGSALFTRGGTQSLVVLTLGGSSDEQIVDGLEGNSREDFMLHYNFPSYCVGESSPLRPPGRREIGHGKLAWRALQGVLADKEQFPYTVRLVSEITESDGSSSMASVCGSSLALMVGGVPVKSHVAGIAMGLIKEGDKHVILSDILGDEDYLGDMDFKVAGTTNGVTALQMDIKVRGINHEIMIEALEQAKHGRLHILDKMNRAISSPRESLKDSSPRIMTLQINAEDITKVIGVGGRVIKNICEVSEAKIDIDPEGKVLVSAPNEKSIQTVKQMIDNILAVPKVGVIYDGVVSGVVEFGVFVKFLAETEGLVHVSEISENRVESIEEFLKIGDKVKVVVLSIERNNKVRLSIKCVDQTTGELLSEEYSEATKKQVKPRKRVSHRAKSIGGNNHKDTSKRTRFF